MRIVGIHTAHPLTLARQIGLGRSLLENPIPDLFLLTRLIKVICHFKRDRAEPDGFSSAPSMSGTKTLHVLQFIRLKVVKTETYK